MPTKEEIIEDVRKHRKQTPTGVTDPHHTSFGTMDPDDGKSPADDAAMGRTPGSDETRERDDGSASSSVTGIHDGVTQRNGKIRKYSSSPVTRRIKTSIFPFFNGDSVTTQKKEEKKKETKLPTQTEINSYRPKLIKGLMWLTEHADEFVQATTKGHEYVTIWSDMDEDEIGLLANIWLAQAKQNVKVANSLRKFVTLTERGAAGLIVGRRMYKTLFIYLQRGIALG